MLHDTYRTSTKLSRTSFHAEYRSAVHDEIVLVQCVQLALLRSSYLNKLNSFYFFLSLVSSMSLGNACKYDSLLKIVIDKKASSRF